MVINAFLLSLLPLVAGSAIPSRYRQLSPRAGRNTQEEVEYVWPSFRYFPFSDLFNDDIAVALDYTEDIDPYYELSNETLAIETLNYTEDSWNSPGTAEIETIAFSDLSDDQQIAAASWRIHGQGPPAAASLDKFCQGP